MDYSQYLVVPIAHRKVVEKLFEPVRVVAERKFLIVISDKQALANKLDVAMDFHNDEWSAWGFTVLAKGKEIAHGLFGENAESGVSIEDNCLEGDLDHAARLLGADARKLRAAVEDDEPDVERFMKVVGFGRYSVTPYQLDRALAADPSRGAKNAKKAKAGKAKAGKAKAGKAKAGKAKAGKAKAGKARAGKARAGKARAGKAKAGKARAGAGKAKTGKGPRRRGRGG